MDSPVDASLSVSRPLFLSPMAAEAALAACEASLTVPSRAPEGRILVTLAGGTAELRPAPLSGTSKGFRRRLVGVLRSRRRWLSVPVEVEVGPGWPELRGLPAEERTVLRVRPVGPTCLRSPLHHRAFSRLAPALAEWVAFELDYAAEVTCA